MKQFKEFLNFAQSVLSR